MHRRGETGGVWRLQPPPEGVRVQAGDGARAGQRQPRLALLVKLLAKTQGFYRQIGDLVEAIKLIK